MKTSQASRQRSRTHPGWGWMVGLAIVLGVGFRLGHIDQKVYWFDEVYTTFRAAGHRGGGINQALFQNQPIAAPQLKQYQQLKPGSTVRDTLRSLALEDPQHPPLYFLLARVWMQVFGSSILASRTLPVLISLVSLPLMYLLGMELFENRLAAWFATALLALSPVDILFAQTARQYSLLTLSVIASGWLLLRALRLNHPRAWGWYGLSVALGLYGHVFFLLNWVSQGVFVVWQRWPRSQWPLLLRFGLASGLGFWLYSPWIWVMLTQRDRGLAATSWASVRVDALTYFKQWLFSFSTLVIDFSGDPRTTSLALHLLRLPVLALFGFGFWMVIKTAPRRQTAFVLTAALGPFLLLVLPDVLLGGKRSIVTRYLLGAFPGVQLATGYGLAVLAANRPRLTRLIWMAILAGSLISGLLSARADTWWVKGVSAENGRVAGHLNAATTPLIITDRGDNYLNKGNLLSLGYRLDPGVTFLPASYPPQPARFTPALANHQGDLLAYHPSRALLDALQTTGFQPQPSQTPGLWHLTHP
ncbi:MAG: glycosyltransferase family 39 protein [Nodosilinea sp.]